MFYKIAFWIVGLYLFLTFAPHPPLDCTRYHADSFHGIYVGCGGGK